MIRPCLYAIHLKARCSTLSASNHAGKFSLVAARRNKPPHESKITTQENRRAMELEGRHVARTYPRKCIHMPRHTCAHDTGSTEHNINPHCTLVRWRCAGLSGTSLCTTNQSLSVTRPIGPFGSSVVLPFPSCCHPYPVPHALHYLFVCFMAPPCWLLIVLHIPAVCFAACVTVCPLLHLR